MHFHLGKLYAENNRTDEAIQEFRKAVDFNPGLYGAWSELANLYAKKSWHKTAGGILETLLRLPENEIAQLGTSRAELTQRAEETRDAWSKAHAQSGVLFQQGQEAFQSQDLKEAVSKFLEAHYVEPDNPFVLYSLGVAHAASHDGNRAAQAFRDALARDPAFVAAKFRLGLVLEAGETYPPAKTAYRQLLAMPNAQATPEYGQAQERLAAIKARAERWHEAELHQEQGVPVVNKREPPGQQELTVALWHLKRAVELNPDIGRYYFNLGLLHEKAVANRLLSQEVAVKESRENLDLYRHAIEAYRSGTEREPAYLAPYLRLGQIYELAGEVEKALALYAQALLQKPVAPSQQATRVQIEQRVAEVTRRLYFTAGFQIGFDNNVTASDPRSEDQFHTLSADLSYFLVKRPKTQLSLGYQLQTSYYLRNQIFFSNSGFSAGLQRVFSPRFVGGLRGRSQLSFVRDEGLTSALSEETVSITYYGNRFPSVGTLQYSFLGVSYAETSSQNTLQHQGTASITQRIRNKYTVDGGYVFTVHHRAASPDNEYLGHQLNLRVQWPIKDDLTVNASVGEFYQQFLNEDSRNPQEPKRRNTLFSYGVGVVKRLAASTSLSADVQVQRNDSSQGVAPPADALDILLNRASSLGTYQKRIITVGINHSF
jgi:tetratricopeptide (TPR) repeat protein